MDRARACLLARAGRIIDEALSQPALAAALNESATARLRADRSALQDIARLRGLLASAAVHALYDAPWLPIYLLPIFMLHPALGAMAVVSALALFAVGLGTERFVRRDGDAAVASSRAAALRIEALVRNAEVLVGMSMLGNALRGWHATHPSALDMQDRLGDAGASLAALWRALRQVVQVAMLGLGAWLVVTGDASPGITVVATVLIGRALQPVEHLIAGWKALVDVQDVELFAGTVAHNIAQLGDIDSRKVIEAARLAGVHEMIVRLPQGYETEIGDGGTVLSAGQRQRIGLARALYGAPKLAGQPAVVLVVLQGSGTDGNGAGALSGIYVNTFNGQIWYNPTTAAGGDSALWGRVAPATASTLDATDFVYGV